MICELRERSELREDRDTTVVVTHDLLSGMPLVLLRKELIRLWNRILPEPGQPSAQLAHIHHCMQEDQAYSEPVV